MPSIILERYKNGVLQTVASPPGTVKLSDSLGAYGILNNATGLPVVAPTGNLPATGAGVYEYDVSALGAGSYLGTFEVNDPPEDIRYFNISFTIDESAVVPIGTRIMDIEKRLARRVGPFLEKQVALGSSESLLVSTAIRSSLDLGGYNDLHILRRGFRYDGTKVTGFNPDDRVRLVASYDHNDGTFVPDNTWFVAPSAGEVFELHYLHPDDELRFAVVEGLRRCFFVDTISLTLDSAAAERSLAGSLPWLENPKWVHDVAYQASSSLYGPQGVGWFSAYFKGATPYLRVGNDPYPNSLVITAKRPAHTYVNGATSIAGPNDDEDVVPVDINYAVAAAHVEAWRNYAPRLVPVAQTGMTQSLKQAANEFTKLSIDRARRKPHYLQFSEPLTEDTFLVVNG